MRHVWIADPLLKKEMHFFKMRHIYLHFDSVLVLLLPEVSQVFSIVNAKNAHKTFLARQSSLVGFIGLIIQKESKKSEKVSEVEPVWYRRYSSQLQLRSGLGMLVSPCVCVCGKVTENRAKDFLAFLHECSLL